MVAWSRALNESSGRPAWSRELRHSSQDGGGSAYTCEAERRTPANASCQCLDSLQHIGINASAPVGIGGVLYDYGPGYGVGGCSAHDALLPPSCEISLPRDSARVSVELPTWCFLPWCYVNASACAGSGVATVRAKYEFAWTNTRDEHRSQLHYSYETCNSHDMYTKGRESASSAPADDQRVLREVLLSTLISLLVLVVLGLALCGKRRRSLRMAA